MPCLFCIAVVTAVAAQAGVGLVDLISDRLASVASGPVARVADTGSVARLEATVAWAGHQAPVALTLYKAHDRVRIQIRDHALPRDEAEKLQNHLAELCGLAIVERSSSDHEAAVRQAMEQPAAQAQPDARPRARGAWQPNPLRQPPGT